MNNMREKFKQTIRGGGRGMSELERQNVRAR